MPIPADGYVVMALLGAIAGEWLFPLALLPATAFLSPMSLIGLVLVATGLSLEIVAAQQLTAADASTRPNGAATALVTTGIYRWSRNPFYIGILLLVAGVMMGFSLDWGVVFLPLLWLGLDRLVIPVEERRLEGAFGPDFRDYAANTKRWL